MKNNKLLRRILLFSILFVISQVFIIYSVYHEVVNDLAQQAYNISETVAKSIDVDKYLYIAEHKERNSYFNDMQAYFKEVQKINNVKYIYTQNYVDSKTVEYIFDAEKDSLGETDIMTDPDAFSNKDGLMTGIASTPEWGRLITGFYPLKDSNNKIVGLVGTDISTASAFSNYFGIIVKYILLMALLFIGILLAIWSYNKDKSKGLVDFYGQIVNTLGMSIQIKSKYTLLHSENVSKYAEIIAKEMKIADKTVTVIRWAALLHDVGKIGIENDILDKPGKLTAEEYEIIKKHPVYSREILSEIFDKHNSKHSFNLEDFNIISDIASYHHERLDSKGYPYGLSAEQIPLTARIVSLADAFEAMTAERPYKKPMPLELAYEQIRINTGTQFDPAVADAFFKCVDKKL
ncbi:MAG: HD domain-containing protein, partial [Bacillota bacterium]|nr:HD domain-containing protein [Bacillota bacterium]